MKQMIKEQQPRSIISNIVRQSINEAIDPVSKIQSLIQQANDAYHNADNEQGGTEWPLMDKRGNSYGLASDIKLDGRGYIIFPFNGGDYSGYSDIVKIKVLTKSGGKIHIIPGDWYQEGWKDASKLLKKIIKDAEIGIGNFKEYDPNWETSDSKEELKANKSALRNMNKKIGRYATAGMDYISENQTSDKKAIKVNENMLRQTISESVKKVLKESVEVDDFSIKMNKLYTVVKDCCGSDSIRDCIASWLFDFDSWDNESKVVPCRYSKRGMYYLLHILTDYDLISINQKTIDIKNSNHPDIAKLIKPYVDSEMCSKVYEYFMNF